MNSHLKGFYPDANLDSNNTSINSNTPNDTSLTNINNVSNLSGTPVSSTLTADSSEYEKKIALINKKLRSYEKRRQKLFFESKKNQDKSEASGNGSVEAEAKASNMESLAGDSGHAPMGSSNANVNESDKKSTLTKIGSSNTINAAFASAKEAQFQSPLTTTSSAPYQMGLHSNTTNNLLNGSTLQPQMTKYMPSDEILFNQFKSFNVSNGDANLIANSSNNDVVSSASLFISNSSANNHKISLANSANTTGTQSSVNMSASATNPFYLNSESVNNDANGNNDTNEENSSSALINNKSFSVLDRERNVVNAILFIRNFEKSGIKCLRKLS